MKLSHEVVHLLLKVEAIVFDVLHPVLLDHTNSGGLRSTDNFNGHKLMIYKEQTCQ